MKKAAFISVSILVLSALLGVNQVAAYPCNPAHPYPCTWIEREPLVAMEYVYNADFNDYLYSVDPAVIETAIYTYGYDDLPGLIGRLGYVEKIENLVNTKPLKRYYGGAPFIDHFYTIDQYEQQYVQSLGYIYEGDEGYFYDEQLPGTIPVTRLSKWNSSTGNLVHYFATSSSEINQKISEGFGVDTTAGYIYSTPNPNILKNRTFAIGRRCSNAESIPCTQEETKRNYYFTAPQRNSGLGYYWQPRTTHRIRFDFMSDDLYGTNGHIAVMLRNNTYIYHPDVRQGAGFNGVGIIIASSCNGQLFGGYKVAFEWWRSTPNGKFTETNNTYCEKDFVSDAKLLAGVTYNFDIQSRDNGDICYTLKQGSTYLEYNKCINVKDDFESKEVPAGEIRTYPMPNFSTAKNTRYSVIPAHDQQGNFTAYFTNFSSVWQ